MALATSSLLNVAQAFCSASIQQAALLSPELKTPAFDVLALHFSFFFSVCATVDV